MQIYMCRCPVKVANNGQLALRVVWQDNGYKPVHARILTRGGWESIAAALK